MGVMLGVVDEWCAVCVLGAGGGGSAADGTCRCMGPQVCVVTKDFVRGVTVCEVSQECSYSHEHGCVAWCLSRLVMVSQQTQSDELCRL